VNPIVGDEGLSGRQNNELTDKRDDTFNYEISKRVRETRKPMAVLTRLSVAAVIDGKYENKTDETGNQQKVYVPRSPEEMKQFQDIVIKSMGYNEERNDQVSMECFPFASIGEIQSQPVATGWKKVQKEYGRTIANLLLVLLLFFFIIRPIIKTVKEIKTTVDQEALPGPEERALIEEEQKEPSFIEMDEEQQKEHLALMTEEQKEAFIMNMNTPERAAYLKNLPVNEKAKYYAQRDLYRTVNILKGWITEEEEAE
jgi:flagellar M-ring protein FliF